MIGSSSVPNKAWLRKKPVRIVDEEELAQSLDMLNEGGVESDVEVPNEAGPSEEGL